jgi:hypothetical protein
LPSSSSTWSATAERVVDLPCVLAGDVVDRLGDLPDVALEDVAALALAAHPLALAQVGAELAPALHERELHLLADLVVVGDRLLALAGERHPHRRHVDHDHERPHRQAAPRLLQAVVLPRGLGDGLEARARALLEEERDAVREADDARGLVGGQLAAEGDRGLDLERPAAVDLGRAARRGVELRAHALEHSREQLAHADRRQAVRRRRREPRLLEDLVEPLRLRGLDRAGLGAARDADRLAHGARGGGADAAEALLQEGVERAALLGELVVLEHLQQDAELDPLRVGLDLAGLRRQLLHAAREDDHAVGLGGDGRPGGGARLRGREHVGLLVLGDARRRYEDDPRVRVRDRGQLEELVDGAAPPLVLAVELDGDGGAGGELGRREEAALLRQRPRAGAQLAEPRRREVLHLLVEGDLGAVGLGVHRQLDVVRRLALLGLREDRHRLAGGDQAVHARGADADALLAAAHLQAVELGPVQQAAEDVLDLLAHDARAVVDDRHAVAAALCGGRAVRLEVLDDHRDLGEDARLLAGVERVVDRLLDGGEHRLARVVEPEQVAVLGEELADGDVALAGGHALGVRPGRGLLPAGFSHHGVLGCHVGASMPPRPRRPGGELR